MVGNIVILDNQENILEFIDDVEAEITDTYKGYKTINITCPFEDNELWRQGNRIFADNCLFVINAEVKFDYISKTVEVAAEEIITELNNEVFYIRELESTSYVKGETIILSRLFLQSFLSSFEVVETPFEEMEYVDKLLTVQGSMTKYNLLKRIEEEKRVIFHREYVIDSENNINRKLTVIKEDEYGTVHDFIDEKITLGESTNSLEYSTDETKNALGIMPILDTSNTSSTDYKTIAQQFYQLEANSKIPNTLYEYYFTKSEIVNAAKIVLMNLDNFHYLPDKITLTFKNKEDDHEENVEIGVVQLFHLIVKQIVADYSNDQSNNILSKIKCPNNPEGSSVNKLFTHDEIVEIAKKTLQYIDHFMQAPKSMNIVEGKLSYHYLFYIFSYYIAYNTNVPLNTENYHIIESINPNFTQENIYYNHDYVNLEYMPYLYLQNSQEDSDIPVALSTAQTNNGTTYDLEKYIGKTCPVLKIKKKPNADELKVEFTTINISQDIPSIFGIFFKEPGKIQDNSEITINFADKSITCMYYVEKTVTEQVTKTTISETPNTITVNHMPSCVHCGGKVAYKRYRKTWVNACGFCGKPLKDNPKGTYEGELTCTSCDADFCGYCGHEKWIPQRAKLTPAEAQTTSTTTETVTKVEGSYEEKTFNETPSENEQGLSDIITAQSNINTPIYGDVSFKITGAEFVSLNSEDAKLFEMGIFPFIKQKYSMYIYAPTQDANFTYTHLSNLKPRLTTFETSEQSVEELLIGCWNKLKGVDETQWLLKSEEISIDTITKPGTKYAVGDTVFVEFPNHTTFTATVSEVKYSIQTPDNREIEVSNVKKINLKQGGI